MEHVTTVLIADSADDFCTALTAALQHADGFQVVGTANDGEQAIRMVEERKPDVLVLDLMLSKKDGISVLKAVSGMERRPITLATSVFVTQYVSAAAANLGVRYLMLKPCDMTALVERLEEIRGGDGQKAAEKRRPDKTSIESMVTGIIHEIGHVFSQGNISGTGRWNWNDEIFANFRMSYALEACDGTMSQRDICYRGADVINYYKIFYDETIGAGIPKNNGDALHYTFLRIKERYGWDVYKKAFRELYALGDSGQEGLETPYDKFLFFLSYVSKAAGEDVVAATYTPGELALIEESLRN